MTAKLGEAVLIVKGDFSDLDKEAEKQIKGPISRTFGSGFGQIAGVVGGAFAGGAIVAGLQGATNAASDLNESINVTGLVFGDAAASMDGFFKQSAQNLGLAESVARQSAGNIGSLLGNLGFSAQDAADGTQELLTRAADLGSAFNAEPADVVAALGAALRGETEPARRFGIMLDKAAIQAKAVELGLADSTKEVDKNAEAQAAMALIMEQSNKVAGDFANTSDGVANSQRIAAAKLENFKAQLGQALLPVVTRLTQAFVGLIEVVKNIFGFLGDHQQELLAVGIALGAIGAVILVSLIPAFIAWAAAAGAAALATLAAAAPFIAIGVAVAAVALVIIKNWDTIKEVTVAVWDAVKGAVTTAIDFVKDHIGTIMRVIVALMTGGFSEAIRFVINNWDQIVAFFRNLPGTITGALGDLVDTLKGLGADVINGFVDGIESVWEDVSGAAKDVWDKVWNELKGLPGKLLQLGKDLIQGLIDGIKSMAGSIVQAIKDFVIDKIPGPIKKFFGIGSPSRLFRGFGRDLMLGLAQGIARTADQPLDALAAVQRGLGVQSQVGLAGTAGAGLGAMAVVDARVVVQGSVIGLDELDRWGDLRDRRLARELEAGRR